LELVNITKPKISIIENVKAFSNGKVLSDKTPQNLKDRVDDIWQKLENFKGQKADLRKKNKLTADFERLGIELRKEKENLMKEIKKGNFLISVIDDLYINYEKIGYKVKQKILNTAWYGASTKRERIIIVAVRNDINIDYKFPIPEYHSKEITTKFDFENIENVVFKKPITLRKALSKIDYSNKKDNDNEPMNHAKKTVDRFKYIKEGGNITDVMDELPNELKISSFYSRGNTMRLHMDKLSPTLVPGHSNFPVHPKEHRSITVREAAVITGFPMDYKFFGNHSKRCEHVGNAVPPPLASAIAKECTNLLDEYYENKKLQLTMAISNC
jgi:DNA (cytosine-5)-methyltransferase 1